MSIDKKTTKDGSTKYQVRYRDPIGRQLKKTFNTKREAQDFDASERTKMRMQEWIDPRLSATSFGDWAVQWLDSNPSKRDSSWSRDEIIVRRHLKPVLGERPLKAITPIDVQRLVGAWSKKMAAQTVQRQYRTLAAIMKSAVNSDLILRSPCRGIKLPKASRSKARIITGDELYKLVDAMGDFGLMATMGTVLGLRWGEVAGLRVDDFNFLLRTVHIRRQVARDRHGRSVITEPKTDSGTRLVSVPQSLLKHVALHMKGHGLTSADDETFLFTDAKGGPLAYSNWLRRVWQPACVDANLEGLGFHDLRRANATAMVAGGVDVKTAQHRLGHSDPRMTLAIYAQVTSTADEAAADKLGEQFLNAPEMRPSLDSEPADASADDEPQAPHQGIVTEIASGRRGTRTPRHLPCKGSALAN